MATKDEMDLRTREIAALEHANALKERELDRSSVIEQAAREQLQPALRVQRLRDPAIEDAKHNRPKYFLYRSVEKLPVGHRLSPTSRATEFGIHTFGPNESHAAVLCLAPSRKAGLGPRVFQGACGAVKPSPALLDRCRALIYTDRTRAELASVSISGHNKVALVEDCDRRMRGLIGPLLGSHLQGSFAGRMWAEIADKVILLAELDGPDAPWPIADEDLWTSPPIALPEFPAHSDTVSA